MSTERFYSGGGEFAGGTERTWPPVLRGEPDRYTRVHPRIFELAAAEYNRQGHRQSAERLAERGGLSLWEIVALLADALEHERGLS